MATPRPKASQVLPDGGPASVLTKRNNVLFDDLEPPAGGGIAAGKPPPPPPGGGGSLYARSRTEGRASARRLGAFYLRTLVPIFAVALWLFALAAALSWAVPNALCRRLAHEVSRSPAGLGACVYDPYGAGAVTAAVAGFWTAFSAAQSAWPAVFPAIVCRALFGRAMTAAQVVLCAALGAGAAAAAAVTGAVYGMPLNNNIVVGTSTLASLVAAVACAPAAARYTGNPLMRWRWVLLFMFAGATNSMYLFVMPRLITARSGAALGGLGLALVRLVVHPAIWTVVRFFFRTFIRHVGHVPDLMTTCFLIWPMIYSAVYGRFLLLQLGNVGSVVVVDFMMAALSLLGALADRVVDGGWLKALYGARARDALTARPEHEEMVLAEELTQAMTEVASILAASAVLSFGGVAATPGVPPDHRQIWVNAAIQLCTALGLWAATLAFVGKFHSVRWRAAWPRPGHTRRLVAAVLVVTTLGGGSLCLELLLLFCPTVYEGHGVLLEPCNRPSLFDAVRFSVAHRAAGSRLGGWLGVGAGPVPDINA